jgi:hypothetical protein
MAMLYLGDLTVAADLFARAPLNRDDRPIIEFRAPRLTRMTTAGDKDWFTGLALADFTDALATRLAGAVEPVLPRTEAVAEARRAGAALYRYAIAARDGDPAAADRSMAEVRRLVPEVRTLEALKGEQERLRQQLHSMEKRLPPPLPPEGGR